MRAVRVNWSLSWLLIATLACVMATMGTAPAAFAATSCPAANPADTLPDDAALQACLNQGGTLTLDPGSPGYILSQGLAVTVSTTSITTSTPGTNATLVAASTLNAPLLSITSSTVSHTTINHVTFDGNRPSRTDISSCTGNRNAESTIVMTTANALDFEYNNIMRTVCGSALNLAGTTMTVAHNTITDNGHGREAVDAPEPWSDGITLSYCAQGDIHDNLISDASDVGVVAFESTNCSIHNNTIQQANRHAFAGLQFGASQPGTDGSHSGSVIQNNTVTGAGKLSFGIAYGVLPWFSSTVHNGQVAGNAVSGAIINLLVDGVQSGNVGMNTLSSPAGTPQCPASDNAPVNYDLDLTHVSQTVTLMAPDAVRSYSGCIP
ncbi:MAG: hypothetical protein QOE99_81 [Actinomycetota bacterium]|nr:hypothetical protein [Actinomycetota bacterium]